VAKAEWGTKRTCPKCSTRFYDLGNSEPVVCIDCGESWVPEPILKSKQPIAAEKPKEKSDEKSEDLLAAIAGGDDDDDDADSVAEDLGVDDDDDDALISDVSLDDDDDAEVTGMVDNKLTKGED